MTLSSTLKTFAYILWREAIALRAVISGYTINAVISSPLMIFVLTKLMISMGASHDFVPIMVASEITSLALYLAWGGSADLAADLQHTRQCAYFTRLPIPSSLAMCRYAVSSTAKSFIVCVMVFIVSKIWMWKDLPFDRISFPKLILTTLLNCIIFGFVTILIGSRSKDLDSVSLLFIRFIIPLWLLVFFGSWQTLFKIVPIFGYIALFSPMTYVTDALRSSLIGPEGFINYWICLLVMVTTISALAFFGLRSMKKRLDYV